MMAWQRRYRRPDRATRERFARIGDTILALRDEHVAEPVGALQEPSDDVPAGPAPRPH